jgi:hypothetical protein
MFCVETNSFLPNEQSGDRDLARQGEPRQMRLHASGDAGLVKVLEGSHGRGGSRRCTLEDIFQIVIMVDVEPADGQDLLGAFQLATPLQTAAILSLTHFHKVSRAEGPKRKEFVPIPKPTRPSTTS